MRNLKTSLSAFLLAGIITAATSSNFALAQQTNDSSYDAITAKAKQLDGPPVNITSNYWLAWTGAWDTVILKEAKLWEKWLPKDSKVEWKRNLQGPPVITDLLANKQQIGYIGDSPAVVSTTKQDIHPIHIVAMNEMSPSRMCGAILVRKDAPEFKTMQDAIKWLQGKTVGVPKGSCADRLGHSMLASLGVEATWQQMQAEVIVTSLQAGKIDAAAVYEPHASKAVEDGFAKYAASAASLGQSDANIVVMRSDFIKEHRNVAIAWLKANIQALYFLRDKPIETIEFVKKELPQYPREVLWHAIYAQLPANTNPSEIGLQAPMVITPEAEKLIAQVYSFLRQIKVVQTDTIAKDAIMSDLVTQAFTDLGLDPKKGLFEIKALDPSKNPFKGDALKSK